MDIKKDFPLKDTLWYKIGGTAKYFIICQTKEDIAEALEFVNKNNIQRVFILGLGSNLIFTDDYFDGAVIHIAKTEKDEEGMRITKDGYVEAFAGEVLDSLITFSLNNQLLGLEWAGGLPGTVGAGVRGNVGAFGGEIKDSIESVDVLDYSQDNPVFRTISNDELQFSYRDSLVKQSRKMVVITARFRLKKGTDEEIEKARKVYEKNRQYRKDRHPLEYPNCGSVFKNIKAKEDVGKVLQTWPDIREQVETKWHGKVSMGYVIKRLGLSGFQVGAAKVSEKHCNFIINLGGAATSDVLTITERIKKEVFNHFLFYPEIEVEIVN